MLALGHAAGAGADHQRGFAVSVGQTGLDQRVTRRRQSQGGGTAGQRWQRDRDASDWDGCGERKTGVRREGKSAGTSGERRALRIKPTSWCADAAQAGDGQWLRWSPIC